MKKLETDILAILQEDGRYTPAKIAVMLDKSEIKDEDLKSCRIIQAGSCSLSAGKAVEATEYAMARAHELGKMVGFDINYRNLMWNDDRKACTKEVLSILKYVDFLKLSE